ncbi:MAG: hypothetical protein ACI9K2_007104, partial [Myxococcota bacterium]
CQRGVWFWAARPIGAATDPQQSRPERAVRDGIRA